MQTCTVFILLAVVWVQQACCQLYPNTTNITSTAGLPGISYLLDRSSTQLESTTTELPLSSSSSSSSQSLSSSSSKSSIAIGDVVASGIGLTKAQESTFKSQFSSSSTSNSSTHTASITSTTTFGNSTLVTSSSTSLTSAAALSSPPNITTSHPSTTIVELVTTTIQLVTTTVHLATGQPTFAANSSATNSTLVGCLASHVSYASANSSWYALSGRLVVQNSTFASEFVATYETGPSQEAAYTTLCDGWPRAHGSYSSLTLYSTTTTWSPVTSIASLNPTPPPVCSLQGDQCGQWWTSQWFCSYSSVHGYTASSCNQYMIDQPCSQPADFMINDRPPNCGVGVIEADNVQLLYWPVTRENYDVCNRNGSTITNNATNNAVRTAVIDGTTITSPYVALSFSNLYATDGCGLIGTTMASAIVQVPETDISSGNRGGGRILGVVTRFDYGDLSPNILPASAWLNERYCYSVLDEWFRPPMPTNDTAYDYVRYATGAAYISSFGQAFPACGTIWEGGFQPDLSVPTQVNDLQTAWKSCTGVFGAYDPPKSLSQVSSEAQPTTPGAVTSESATPSQTASVAQQTQTTAPAVASTSFAPSEIPTASVAQQTQSTALAFTSTSFATSESSIASEVQQTQSTAPAVTSTGVTLESPVTSEAQQTQSTAPAVPFTSVVTSTSPVDQTTTIKAPESSEGLQLSLSTSGGPQTLSAIALSSTTTIQTVSSDSISLILTTASLESSKGSPNKLTTSTSGGQQSSVVDTASVSPTATQQQAETVSPSSAGSHQQKSASTDQSGTATQQSGSVTVANVASTSQDAGGIIGSLLGGATSLESSAQQTVQTAPTQGTVAETKTATTSPRTESSGGQSGVQTSPTSAAPQQTVANVGTQQVTISRASGTSSAVIVAGGDTTITLTSGASAATVGGQQLSINPAGVVVASSGTLLSTLALPSSESGSGTGVTLSGGTVISIGASTILAQSSSNAIVLGTNTLTVQGDPQTVDGQVVSAASDGLHIGTSVVPVPSAQQTAANDPTGISTATQAVSTGSQAGQVTVQQQGSSVVVADRTSTVTVALGSQTTFNGELISAPSTGGAIVLDGSSLDLSTSAAAAHSAATAAVVTGSGGQAVTIIQVDSAVILQDGSSTTTVPAGTAATFGGQTFSFATSASHTVLLDGSPVILSTTSVGQTAEAGAVITASNGQPITIAQQGSLVIVADASSTTTIPLGAQATFDGQIISIPSSASVVKVDGSIVSLSSAAADPTGVAEAVVTASNGQLVTIAQSGSIVLVAEAGSTTVLPLGAQATFAGQIISIPATAGVANVDGSLVSLASAAADPAGVAEAVVTAPSGQLVTIAQSGSVVVVAEAGSTTVLTLGAQATFNSQIISIPSTAGIAVVGGSLVALPGASSDPAAVAEAVVTASNGQLVTIVQSGSAVVLADASSTATLPAGVQATFDGVAISVTSTGGLAAVDGTFITLSSADPKPPAATVEAIVTASSGQRVTILQQGSSIVLQDSTQTVTLAAGAQATFDGVAVSVPSTSGLAVVGGTFVTLSSADPEPAATAEAVITASNGQIVTILQQGSSVVLQDSTETVTLAAGQQTVIDGQTFSAPLSTGVVVVDGSTVPFSRATLTTSKPASEQSVATAGTAQTSSTSTSSSDRIAVVLVHVLASACIVFALAL